ncbi:hypothetical protein [Nesterenkonia sp.]|uniref:hypothetical protein n=1 Tax=Nesterenkonia sp. TaxID=704201 RepID=UPI0026376CA8|nr:hypothetical protein [Nesterenkonia sp.]
MCRKCENEPDPQSRLEEIRAEALASGVPAEVFDAAVASKPVAESAEGLVHLAWVYAGNWSHPAHYGMFAAAMAHLLQNAIQADRSSGVMPTVRELLGVEGLAGDYAERVQTQVTTRAKRLVEVLDALERPEEVTVAALVSQVEADLARMEKGSP